jgi:hypothetical protein
MLRANKEQCEFCPKIVLALIHWHKATICFKNSNLSKNNTIYTIAANLYAGCVKIYRCNPAARLLNALFGPLNIPSNHCANMGHVLAPNVEAGSISCSSTLKPG